MSEQTFRVILVALLAIIVVVFTVAMGSLVLIANRYTENGRYEQYDFQRDHVIFGNSMENPTPKAFDTRTGKAVRPSQ